MAKRIEFQSDRPDPAPPVPLRPGDRITDYEPGQWAKGRKCVSVNEQFFCGHFPQEHVMPAC